MNKNLAKEVQSIQQTGKKKRKILFIAEAVTLAHVARPFTLARSLDPDDFDVVLASHPRYKALLVDSHIRHIDIFSISTEHFLGALAKGTSPYSREIFKRYIKDDITLLETEKPDIVVGDFRLSLSVSSRLKGVPYLAISNAYWSPYAKECYPIPEHPTTRIMGVTLAEWLFNRISSVIFASHTAAFNTIMRSYGLPDFGTNLRRLYTEADYTLYADIPQLVPLEGLPANHLYIGPIAWSPAVELPDWWEYIVSEIPMVYVALGSSGKQKHLPQILSAIADMPINIVVASASAIDLSPLPENVFVSKYLPGDVAAGLSSLVICNGGSPTTYQALLQGVPVIGIASNLDQHLNMRHIEEAGVGITLRSDRWTRPRLVAAVTGIMQEDGYRERAISMQRELRKWDPTVRFPDLIQKIV